MAEPSTPFPYDRLPNEVKFLIWEEFVKAEAASRIVPLNISPGDYGNEDELPGDYWLVPSIMPLKRLVSPALELDTISRKVALRHYCTRINIYEMPIPIYKWQSFEEWEEDQHRFVPESRAVWASRDAWTDKIENCTSDSTCEAMCLGPIEDDMSYFADVDDTNYFSDDNGTNYFGDDEANNDSAGDEQSGDEDDIEDADYIEDDDCSVYEDWCGCVYLDLATDRFLPFSLWDNIWPGVRRPYGLRELSDAIADFKYNGVALDETTFRDILARRPPVLRNASAHLSDEVLMGIRHVVFPSLPPPGTNHNSSNPWSIEADPEEDITAINTPELGSGFLARTLPGAFGATPSSTTWGFAANSAVCRSFWDDIEDKGPEHLYIQQATVVNNGSDPEDWELVWGGGNANNNDESSGEDNDDDGGSSDDYDGGDTGSDADSDFEMGGYSDENIGDGSSSDGDSDDEM
ncbi:hypothetical protein PG991_003455 [Apiospora marii]|uniref:Uncharacterized protein n=1 Tax=Apiospora marii TaxID=335849 RepID=A0ABR1S593_9PEZI